MIPKAGQFMHTSSILLKHYPSAKTNGIAINWKLNKTAGYHRKILRLPFYAKKFFKKMKTFSRKKLSSSNFLIFLTFKGLGFFCQEKPHKKGGKIIFKTDYRSTANLLPVAILEKFKLFSKNLSIFSKKSQILKFLRILLFQWHSKANLLQFGQKSTLSETWTNLPMWRECSWQTLG